MKILLCGADKSAFMSNMVSRLNKEKHEVFVITGNKRDVDGKEKGVFQQYTFTFNEVGVANIINNVGPEVVIFFGALDANYSHEWNKSEVVAYVSGLTNVLLCAKNAMVKRFVYVSSTEVFRGNAEATITEATIPMPVEDRDKGIMQGEKICDFYRDEDFDVSIIRVGNVYGGFGRYVVEDAVVNSMYQKMVQDQNIVCDKNKTYLMTYLSDAVEAVFRTAISVEKNSKVQMLIGERIQETDLAKQLSSADGRGASIVEKQKMSTSQAFNFELQNSSKFRLKYNTQDGLMEYLKFRSRVSQREAKEERKKKNRILQMIMPFVETVVTFLVVLLIQWFGEGTILSDNVDFYFLFVVLIASVHGTNCGLLAIVLSVLGKLSMDVVERGIAVVAADYTKYLWVLQVLILGVLVGFMRDKYFRKSRDLSDDLHYTSAELESLEKINQSNVYVKNVYEKRLINYRNSLAKIYEITSQLDFMDSRKVSFQTVKVVEELMECQGISIYTRSGGSDYFRMMASNCDNYKQIGNSFRYNESFELYQMLEEDGIYRNRQMQIGFPLMASCVRDDDKAQTIIMIWSMGLEDVNQYQINLFKVLTRMIEKSLVRANDYMEQFLQQNAYYTGTNVMKMSSMEELEKTYQEGKEMGVFEYATLYIVRNKPDDRDWILYLESVKRCLRDADAIGVERNGNAKILLGASGEKEARIVQVRLEEKSIITHLAE